MSWLFGTLQQGGIREEHIRDLRQSHAEPLFSFAAGGFYVAAGGLPETCLYAPPEPAEGRAFGWIAVGVAIQKVGGSLRRMDRESWAAVLTHKDPPLDRLDGHFAVVRWDASGVQLFTDSLGLRSLYYRPAKDGVVISSRAEWLSQAGGGLPIDYERFGSHWLQFNQLSTRSMVRGLERVGPGERVTLGAGDPQRTRTLWQPAESGTGLQTVADRLRAVVDLQGVSGRSATLGLSGGMDSRVLLAVMMRGGKVPETYVLGDPVHPDAHTARRIARGEGLPLTQLAGVVPEPDACLELLRREGPLLMAGAPASAVLTMAAYPALHAQQRWLLGGGFGEIARRQFLNRLRYRGRGALRRGDMASLQPLLAFSRADVFARDAMAAMHRGVGDDLRALGETLPMAGTVGIEAFVDIFAVRTRLPNAYGIGQALVDERCIDLMPFAQPSVLGALLGTPARLRRGGHLVRRLIREAAPSLERYPLVKGNMTYPFRLSAPGAWAWTAVAGRVQAPYRNDMRAAFLNRLRPFALDTVHAADVREYAPYDHPRLLSTVTRYYDGDLSLGVQVDWWLAFEVWRQALKRPLL